MHWVRYKTQLLREASVKHKLNKNTTILHKELSNLIEQSHDGAMSGVSLSVELTVEDSEPKTVNGLASFSQSASKQMSNFSHFLFLKKENDQQ